MGRRAKLTAHIIKAWHVEYCIDNCHLGLSNIHDIQVFRQRLKCLTSSRSRRLVAYADMSPLELGVIRRACGFCTLNELCWRMELAPADLDRLQTMVVRAGPLAAGTYLFRTGDPFTAIYAVRSGCIKSHSIDASGHELVHGFHFRGEVLGFDAVYPDHHRCNALLLESSSLCVIPYREVARLGTEFQSLHDVIIRLMGREFSKQLMVAEGRSATQRIANFLLDMQTRLNPAGAVTHEFTLPMSREDISNYLCITPETLSRLLAKLQNMGLIEVDRRHIFVVEPIRLGLIARSIN